MIKITALNKKYKTKKRKECHALNNINLTLPNRGLVFVLGKSGSGKSTLLNLIGGLDSITSGRIEVDGNDLSTFKEKDFCNYRNTHVGFIFQDYHLIDELTVYENIVLSLNLRRIEDKELVKAALEKVDLAGYEDRYPTELSGGEQQRVAIARAIVKNPRIILADEPTGNLDTHTAKAIVELLKELSKDCLILIVSHNVNDANSYADRIIELSKGKIISDKSRNPEFADEMTLSNGELVYPDGLILKDRDIDFINDNLNKRFIKRADKFIDSPEIFGKSPKTKIENKSLSPGKELNLSGKFLKNKTLVISFSAFMVSVIMVIMALAQTIVNFNGSHIIADEMAKGHQSSILMNKVVDDETQARLDGNYRVKVDDGDIQALYDAGYTGEIYPVLNVSVPVSSYGNASGKVMSCFSNYHIYLRESLGTMVVDETFFESKYGEIKYLSKLDTFDPSGVIITDYVADSILFNNTKYTGKTYDDIVGMYYYPGFSYVNLTINAIIDTGYKEKHKALFEKLSDAKEFDITKMYEDSAFTDFFNDVYDGLGYSYTTNPDFVSDYVDKAIIHHGVFYQKLMVNGYKQIGGEGSYGVVMIRGEKQNTNIVAAWYYTNTPPHIPHKAKYIRVSYGTSSNVDQAINDNEELQNLPAAQKGYAHLVFSNGYEVEKEKLNYKNYSWLDKNNGETSYQFDRPTSYVSDYIEIPDGATISELCTFAAYGYAYCTYYDENKNFISSIPVGGYDPIRGFAPIEDNTVIMNYQHYNDIFGTNYDESSLDEFVPHEITLTQYRLYDADCSEPIASVEVTVIGLRTTNMSLGDNLIELFSETGIYVNAIYLDGTDGIGNALNVAEELNYEPQSVSVEGIHSMTRAVDVFVPIFELISIFLYIGVIFILMNFASKMINDKMHEIGILKALGTKNGSIGVVFGLQVGLIALLTCGLSTLGYYLFIDVANDILIESIHRIAPSWTLPDLQFLTFKPEIALMNCILIFALAFVSLIFPMIKIKAIKPVKIIKAKE